MKIMVIARLFSGLNTLLESGHWEHAGSPAYYHFIRGLDAETSWDYTLCFLLPHPYTGFECKRSLNITNLRSSALIVPYYSLPFSSSFTLIKKAEYFYNKLKKNNFNLEMIKNYYFFQINRWDLILNNGLLIKFPAKELDEAIILAKKLIKDSNFKNIEIIDLRIKGRIITQ